MIIYLHGFNSSGQSEKAAMLKNLLPEIRVVAPEIPSDLTRAIPFLESHIELFHAEGVVLVGSSLGGYFARYLGQKYGYPVVLINPALYPVPLLIEEVGKQTNYYTGEEYILTESAVRSLADYKVDDETPPIPTLVLLDEDDELIDSTVAEAVYKQTGTVKVYPGGSHRFDHLEESIDLLRRFLKDSSLLQAGLHDEM